MSQRGVEETVTLFNSLEYAPPASFQLDNEAERRGKQNMELVLFLARDKIRTLLSLSMQDLLLVLMLFAVKLFVPLYGCYRFNCIVSSLYPKSELQFSKLNNRICYHAYKRRIETATL